MTRTPILVLLLCVLGATASNAQSTPEPIFLVFPGSPYEVRLDSLFDEYDAEIEYEATSDQPDKVVASLSAVDTSLVISLTNAVDLGDVAQVTVSEVDDEGTSRVLNVIVDERPEIDVFIPSPREPEVGDDLMLEVSIDDNSRVAAAFLLFREGGGEVRCDRMTLDNPGRPSVKASYAIGDTLADRGLEYGILAFDEHLFPAISPTEDHGFYLPIRSPGNTTQVAGEQQYRLFSVPLNLEAKSPESVLRDDLGAYDDTQWRFFEVMPDFSFVEFPNTINMIPGKAFLLNVKDREKVIDTGPGVSIPTTAEYPIELQKGWNFIGNPFTYPIPVSRLRLDSHTDETEQPVTLRFFDGTSWNDPMNDPVRMIEPFEGYALQVERDDVLYIDPNVFSMPLDILEEELEAFGDSLASGLIDPAIALDYMTARCRAGFFALLGTSEPAHRESIAWSIGIQAQSGQARDVDTRAVAAPGASRLRDRLDHAEPPGFGDHVSVYFTPPEGSGRTVRLSTDARPLPTDGVVWPFEVTTTARDNVRLTFDGLADVPSGYEVWLIDDVLETAQNLRETPTYTLAGTAEPRALKLVVGRPGFIENEVETAQTVPMRFELLQNFPNPFNPSTTLRYGVPDAAAVSLVVYDVLGRQVAVLENGIEKAAGYHTVVWDGRSDAGTPVAGGVYFARMRAGRFVQTQKMVLVK